MNTLHVIPAVHHRTQVTRGYQGKIVVMERLVKLLSAGPVSTHGAGIVDRQLLCLTPSIPLCNPRHAGVTFGEGFT